MSRKDYVMIAEAIKRVKNEAIASGASLGGIDRVIGEFALAFAKDNERFDMHRFVTACEASESR